MICFMPIRYNVCKAGRCSEGNVLLVVELVGSLYGKVGLTSHVSGILPVVNGGTNSGQREWSSIMVSDGFR